MDETREWKDEIRRRLADADLAPTAEAQVVEELAQHLDDRYRELCAGGASHDEARQVALAELADLAEGERLADALRDVRGSGTRPTMTPGEPLTSGGVSSGSLRGRWGGPSSGSSDGISGGPPQAATGGATGQPSGGRSRRWVESVGQDVRYATRMLRARPGFAAVAVLTLALGIGANTAIFSLINTVLFRPVFAERPEELITVFFGDAQGNGSTTHSYANYLDYRRESRDVLSGLAAYGFQPVTVAIEQRGERLNVGIVTDNYFGVLGVRPLVGRDFLPDENVTPGAHPVAMISEGLWRRALAARTSLAGTTVRMNGTQYVVIGVVPEEAARALAVLRVDLFVTAMMSGNVRGGTVDPLTERGNRELAIVGRRQPGVPLTRVQARFDVIAARLQKAYPVVWTERGRPLPLTAIAEGDARPSLEMRGYVVGFAALLMAVVGCVLVIACGNLANVLLARGLSRRQEIAVRVALGASRGRLLRQLLAENALIALLGGAAGLLLALWMKGLLAAFTLPIGVPLAIDLALDRRVLLFTCVITGLTMLAFGLLPALQATRPDVVASLKDGQRTVAGARRVSRIRHLLLVGQVALSLLLLVCAGLFLRSLARLNAIDPGFDRARVALASIDLSTLDDAPAARQALVDRAIDRLAGVPGVEAVAVANKVPIGFSNVRREMLPEGMDVPLEQAPLIGFDLVGPRYFDVMGLRLLRGRAFTTQDREGAPPVALVNQAFVDRYWHGQEPVGKRLRDPRFGGAYDVVGVVATSKYNSLLEAPAPFMYFPQAQSGRPLLTFFARTRGAPEALLEPLRRALLAVDPRLAVFDVKTMNEHLAVSLLPLRFGARWLGIFGALALGIAAIGLYGVMAYSVSQRTHEIGVRVALGARHRDVRRLIIRQGMTLIVWGIALGLVPALILTTVAARMLYGITPTDAIVLTSVILVQGGTAWLACWVPARRAVRLDPVAALRQA